jgi:hypothetical protein
VRLFHRGVEQRLDARAATATEKNLKKDPAKKAPAKKAANLTDQGVK